MTLSRITQMASCLQRNVMSVDIILEIQYQLSLAQRLPVPLGEFTTISSSWSEEQGVPCSERDSPRQAQ